MKRVAYVLAVLLVGMTFGVSAEAGGGHRGRMTFEQMDKNGDGKIVQSEVPAEVWERLKEADTNKDNAVTKAEWEAALAQKRARWGHGGPGGHGGPKGPLPTFEQLDKNGDGKIVESEAGEAWRWLVRADANKDNAVTKAEYDAMKAQMDAARASGRGPRLTFEQMDKNGDGKIVASEVTPEVWRWLVRADVNKDNAVTKAEYEALKNSRGGGAVRK